MEFRNPSWIPDRTDEGLHFLAERGMIVVGLDCPWQPLIPAANSDWAVLRFHGQNIKGWRAQPEGKSPTVAEKYEILYDDEELDGLALTTRAFHGKVRKVFTTFNNNYRDFPIRNPLALRRRLGQGAPDPETLKASWQPRRRLPRPRQGGRGPLGTYVTGTLSTIMPRRTVSPEQTSPRGWKALVHEPRTGETWLTPPQSTPEELQATLEGLRTTYGPDLEVWEEYSPDQPVEDPNPAPPGGARLGAMTAGTARRHMHDLPCPRCGRRLTLTRQTLPDLWRLGWRPGAPFRIIGPGGPAFVLSPWPCSDRQWAWLPFWGEDE